MMKLHFYNKGLFKLCVTGVIPKIGDFIEIYPEERYKVGRVTYEYKKNLEYVCNVYLDLIDYIKEC